MVCQTNLQSPGSGEGRGDGGCWFSRVEEVFREGSSAGEGGGSGKGGEEGCLSGGSVGGTEGEDGVFP